MTVAEQRKNAREFAKRWQGRGYEKGDTHSFWHDLLENVLGIKTEPDFVKFEYEVKVDSSVGYIDVLIPSTKVLIEQKSIEKDLLKPERQSDGSFLTPFRQARKYRNRLPHSLNPRWIVTCNFKEFLIYDLEKTDPEKSPEKILLENLGDEYNRLLFLVEPDNEHITKEEQLSFKAGELVGRLYDALLPQYNDPGSDRALKSLNELCVRIVFCLYAEDAGLFNKKNAFHDYLAKETDLGRMRRALIDLFKVLDTPEEKRDPYLEYDLSQFPYVNGGLFSNEDIEIPRFTDEVRDILLSKASDDFNWRDISPTIFGAVFESTLNPRTRRSGGMHYTSLENIHKVIDPLFLDGLKKELRDISNLKSEVTRQKKLIEFQNKLSRLKFLDPACGSGNFLTETYLSLRKLENKALDYMTHSRIMLDTGDIIKVSIGQFYGIEINDFAVKVAKTALWIAEAQMWIETGEIISTTAALKEFLPLDSYDNIVEANALRTDWNDILPASECDYIIGNPPFVGARLMSSSQKEDVLRIFDNVKNSGNLDYVACWYKLAADYMKNTGIEAALVSTNSITQGEQPAILWKNLLNEGIVINFAYRTFRWDSEASIKAHVHCVIIGFSHKNRSEKYIYDGKSRYLAGNINAYLVDAPNILVESRSEPLCDVPHIGIGNKPIDDGNYLFTEEEMNRFIKLEPASAPYFKRWYGADEFINNKKRYCLWVGDCTPDQLRKMPHVLERVQKVRDFRLKSKSEGTRKLADKPTRFHVENFPKTEFLLIPETSSEKRSYTPIGFMHPDVICSNRVRITESATLYDFAVLTSSVHMAWMRVVTGRLKSDYRYSKDIVYNNFPWPDPTIRQREKIEKTGREILHSRDRYPSSSLADLYDDRSMPPDLRRAHRENDRAVLQAYGFPKDSSDRDIVSRLMTMYKSLTSWENDTE